MTFKKRAVLAVASLTLAAFAQNAMAEGAYSSSAVMPTIYSKNHWYTVAPPVLGSPRALQPSPRCTTATAIAFRARQASKCCCATTAAPTAPT